MKPDRGIVALRFDRPLFTQRLEEVIHWALQPTELNGLALGLFGASLDLSAGVHRGARDLSLFSEPGALPRVAELARDWLLDNLTQIAQPGWLWLCIHPSGVTVIKLVRSWLSA